MLQLILFLALQDNGKDTVKVSMTKNRTRRKLYPETEFPQSEYEERV